MTIERGGQPLAKVRKAMFTPFRERFEVECASGLKDEVKGTITVNRCNFERDGNEVANVSRKWLKVRRGARPVRLVQDVGPWCPPLRGWHAD
jgi:uncharacterized protein YxjI